MAKSASRWATASDANQIAALMLTEPYMEFCQFTPVHFYSARLEESIRFAIESGSASYRLIFDGNLSAPFGFVSLNDICLRRGLGEIGMFNFLREPHSMGTGLSTMRALGHVCRHGFETLGLDKIKAEFIETNKFAERLMIRLSFQLEGRCRRKIFRQGACYDTYLFALQSAKWNDFIVNEPIWRFIS